MALSLKDNVRKAFGYTSALFCVSELTKSTLLEFSQRQKISPVPMMTAYNGFEPLVINEVADQIRAREIKPIMGNARYYSIVDLHPLIMVGSVEQKRATSR